MDRPEAWDQMLTDYLSLGQEFTQEFADVAVEKTPLASLFGQQGGQKLKFLDVACGTGVCTKALVEKYNNKENKKDDGGQDVEILATDFSKTAVEYVKSQGYKGVETKIVDATAMDLPSNTYNALLCIFGVMLMPKSSIALSEMYRVLDPNNSLICIVTWNHQSIWPLIHGAAARMMTSSGNVPASEPPKPEVASEKVMSWTDLEYNIEKLVQAGFKDVEGFVQEGSFEIKDLRMYMRMMLRLPGMKNMSMGWSDEKKEQFVEVVVEMADKEGRKVDGGDGGYRFPVAGNVAFGRKRVEEEQN